MNATNTTNTETRDPAALEREASQIRADMDRTLDALERKFSPQQMLDRSLGYLRDHGGDITRTIGDTVKQNPIPVLLTAVGLTWLITSSLRSRAQAASDDYGAAPYDDDTYGAEGALDDIATDAAGAATGVRQKISQRLHQGAERLQQGAESVKESWRSSSTSDRVSNAVSATRDRARQVQQRAATMMDDQPLVIGALAVAAGAIIGAALPSTQVENRTVGPIRDRAVDKAKESGERQYQNLRSKLETRDDMQVSGRAN